MINSIVKVNPVIGVKSSLMAKKERILADFRIHLNAHNFI